VQRADPRAEYTRQFVAGFGWLIKVTKRLLTAKEALEVMNSPGDLVTEDAEARERIDVLRNSMFALLKSDTVNEVQLGILLRKCSGKIRDGVKIFSAGQSRLKSTQWNAEFSDLWKEADMDLDGDNAK
jgi:hypothetical protein